MPVSGPAMMNSDKNKLEDQMRLPVDTSGDLFRNNADYEGLNFRVDEEGDQDMPVVNDTGEGEDLEHPIGTQEEKGEEAELHEALLAEEHWLEPERLTGLPDNVKQEPEDAPLEQAQAPFRLRGGFKRPLANQPEIVKFGNWNTGTVVERAYHHSNQDYCCTVGITDSPNIYALFSSKLDWDIARWAKMQGLGLNALTELLHIEGVRFPATDSQI